MQDDRITFKGSVNGLTIIMNDEDDFEKILEQIEKKVESSSKFFDGASINIKYKGRDLTFEQENKIFELLTVKSGVKVRSVEKEVIKEKNDIEKHDNLKDKLKMKTVFFKGIEEGLTKFHRGTLRSGTLLKFDGNIVILGDVNPGAEIVATGNVVVIGSLRGIVHAGSDGNKDAVISALSLQPTQLRIGDIVTRSPDEVNNQNTEPEIASVKDGIVYIERFLPRR